MSLAHVCGCGDIKSNHRKRTFKGNEKYYNQYFECLVDGCNCKGFEMVMTVHSGSVNYR